MKWLRLVHTGWALLVFGLLFVLFFFPLLVPIFFPARHAWTGILNRWWARCLFAACFLSTVVEEREKLNRKGQYVFCPNHFSYLDIPAMGLTPVNAVFVGKSSMERIPFFGFMYRKLHITVDRSKLMSRYSTLVRSLEALDRGKSLIIFPEGGIFSNGPALARFKDGAFRAAIQKQVPVVPVTIPNNWIILPGDSFRIHAGRPVKVIFHHAIPTTGLALSDEDSLKQQVHRVISEELSRHPAQG
jgi:1-acyl-sn-glycerol-3-phosphate acyltransferase